MTLCTQYFVLTGLSGGEGVIEERESLSRWQGRRGTVIAEHVAYPGASSWPSRPRS